MDESLAEAHATMAMIQAQYDWNWSAAEQEFKRAIELNPNEAVAHSWYSNYLTETGRFAEARIEAKRAWELDPLTPYIQVGTFSLFYWERKYDKAIEQGRRVVENNPGFLFAHLNLAAALEQSGAYEEAIRECQLGIALGDTTSCLPQLGHAYAMAGRLAEARGVLRELQNLSKRQRVTGCAFALMYVGLGENEQALTWLEKACDQREEGLTYLKVDPKLDSLRSHPRFQELMRRLGFSSM
jgi:tetratricopeptide (TPR) repeat protein